MGPGFPLGLGGLYGEKKAMTFKDQEDIVSKFIQDHEVGLLALMFKMLHNLGYRISTVDAQIAELRRKCAP